MHINYDLCKRSNINQRETHQLIDADLQPLQRLAYAALTASEPFRTLMLICVGMLFHITDEMVRGNLGRGLVPSPAWFKPLRPAAHA
jgi:hypothetical protein